MIGTVPNDVPVWDLDDIVDRVSRAFFTGLWRGVVHGEDYRYYFRDTGVKFDAELGLVRSYAGAFYISNEEPNKRIYPSRIDVKINLPFEGN